MPLIEFHIGLHICDMKNPCFNGGKCMKVYYQNESSLEEIESNEYTCKCADGFTGPHCEKGNFYIFFLNFT
jgi:hypothetical protein